MATVGLRSSFWFNWNCGRVVDKSWYISFGSKYWNDASGGVWYVFIWTPLLCLNVVQNLDIRQRANKQAVIKMRIVITKVLMLVWASVNGIWKLQSPLWGSISYVKFLRSQHLPWFTCPTSPSLLNNSSIDSDILVVNDENIDFSFINQ